MTWSHNLHERPCPLFSQMHEHVKVERVRIARQDGSEVPGEWTDVIAFLQMERGAPLFVVLMADVDPDAQTNGSLSPWTAISRHPRTRKRSPSTAQSSVPSPTRCSRCASGIRWTIAGASNSKLAPLRGVGRTSCSEPGMPFQWRLTHGWADETGERSERIEDLSQADC